MSIISLSYHILIQLLIISYLYHILRAKRTVKVWWDLIWNEKRGFYTSADFCKLARRDLFAMTSWHCFTSGFRTCQLWGDLTALTRQARLLLAIAKSDSPEPWLSVPPRHLLALDSLWQVDSLWTRCGTLDACGNWCSLP